MKKYDFSGYRFEYSINQSIYYSDKEVKREKGSYHYREIDLSCRFILCRLEFEKG